MKPTTTPRRLRAVAPQSKPIGGLLDSRFVYVRSEHTDIRKTLDRVRREISDGKRKP